MHKYGAMTIKCEFDEPRQIVRVEASIECFGDTHRVVVEDSYYVLYQSDHDYHDTIDRAVNELAHYVANIVKDMGHICHRQGFPLERG